MSSSDTRHSASIRALKPFHVMEPHVKKLLQVTEQFGSIVRPHRLLKLMFGFSSCSLIEQFELVFVPCFCHFFHPELIQPVKRSYLKTLTQLKPTFIREAKIGCEYQISNYCSYTFIFIEQQ